ncbi:hypothetical protein ACPCTG_32080 [Streptomyces pseudogriseolus]|uniref:hypothetical protein n=1 Tax=Streptomyces pseudogriseolus TaxID=36817 RepID=UPI003FA252F4
MNHPIQALPVLHRCQPPFLARTGSCDCSRCCAAGPHDAGCTSLEASTPAACTCPDDADYHQPDCPEYG